MREANFHSIWNKTFREAGGWSYKIPDQGYFGDKNRFTPKKPFDGITVYQEHIIFWEAKMSSSGIKGISTKALRVNQIEAFEDLSRQGVEPVILYFCYKPREMKRVYVIKYETLRHGLIRKKELEKMEFIKIAKNTFDIEEVFKKMY